jgi:hypothetical protein
MMKTMAWNVRGLNNLISQNQVKMMMHENGIGICGLLETHLRANKIEKTCNNVFGRWKWISNISKCRKWARIVIGWDSEKIDVQVLDMTDQAIHCYVSTTGCSPFYCSFIYGQVRARFRKSL